ncbi:MAG: hypothetical protein IH586_01755, partial [Anaerolineaceae bacterium]|nr:hypothetical protein [Anaerolineaceae bacterium]
NPAFEVILKDPVFQRYPLWVMSFSEPDPERTFADRRWLFWLYRDDFQLTGVSTSVGLSRFNGSQADLLGLSYQGLVEDAESGKVLYPIRDPFAESVVAGSTLVLRRVDGSLEIADLHTYQALVQPQGLSFPGRRALITASSSGQSVAISADNGVTLLNLGGWQSSSLSEKPVSALAFSPDGIRAAFATQDGSISFVPINEIFKSDSYLQPLIQTARPALSTPLPSPVMALAFSPDGGLLAAGMQDGRIVLLETVRGQVLGIYTLAAKSPVTTLTFSPAAAILGVGTSGGSFLVDLRPETLSRLACDLAGREMNVEELRQYGISQNLPGVCGR